MMAEKTNGSAILQVQNLKKYFETPRGLLHAVDDISFDIKKGQTLGVVGESGCGKSTLGRAILRLHEPTSGQVIFDGEDIIGLKKKQLKHLRTRMQIIFQDPYASLNPQQTVSQAIIEPAKVQKMYKGESTEKIKERAFEMMDYVGLPRRLANTFPHELDGGMRQRIGIARALVLNPAFVVCDEPVSALDVSIQAQILNLMQDLQEKMGLTYMFITHDLSVVKHLSDVIAVMYLGQMVEKAPAKDLFANPMHPYTKALISAIPIPDPTVKVKRIILQGELASPINPGTGCRFAKRCIYAKPECSGEQQRLRELSKEHYVACNLVEKQ